MKITRISGIDSATAIIMNADMKPKLMVLLLLLMFLGGCASLAARGLLPDVQARRPPDIDLGRELVIFNEPPLHNASFIGTDGRAHLFLTDGKRQLHHIEVMGDSVVKKEILGLFESKETRALDAVEFPAGKFRVLVGDRQYVRAAPGSLWQEIRGNRCERFLPRRDTLFCAFVIAGDAVGAPQRTDYTVGWIILVPWVSWSNTYATKLVVAQETNEVWIIRAVIDPETNRDADRDFVAATDREGTLHFLYGTSRGGGMFAVVVGAAPGAIGGGFVGPDPELRYARVALDRLTSLSADEHALVSTPETPTEWQSISGTTLPVGQAQRPLARRFTLNQASREVSGLTLGRYKVKFIGGKRQFEISGESYDCCTLMEVGILDGSWLPRLEVVLAEELPDSTYRAFADPVIGSDGTGNLYALVEHSTVGLWSSDHFIDYLVKAGNNWTAPVTLGTSAGSGTARMLAVTDSGTVFATWVNKDDKFVGRWISLRKAE